MKRKPRLHELLAVVPDTANAAQSISDETKNTFTKKPDHFKGQSRSITFFAETRHGENASDVKLMVTTVPEKLDHTFGILGRHFDALLQMEEANTRAFADLTVDGVTLMEKVPATFLLGMEKRLKALREVILTAPTLDPAIDWTPDDAAGAGRFKSAAQTGFRNEKVLQHKVLVAATDKHPAQVEKWTEDVAVAKINTTHTSGMLTPARKSAILDRLDNLIGEVKQARQRANEAEVESLHVADKLFAYIMGG